MSEDQTYENRAEYYAQRAIAEHRRVETATDPRAAAIHSELAAHYEALASDPSLTLPGAAYSDEESPDDAPPEEAFPMPRNEAA